MNLGSDPKWLEILKASGWQTTGLAAAFGLFLLMLNTGILPKSPDPLWTYIPTLAFLICTFLSLAAIGDALVKAIKPTHRLDLWIAKRHGQRSVREFIPYMTDQDKAIIGYLLHHNQKVFSADQDGGYAAPLIAKGIIRIAVRHGQVVDLLQVPFEIPDHIWTVLEEQREQFPYRPPPKSHTEKHPWAVSWMVR